MKEKTFLDGKGSIKENLSVNVANYLSQFTQNEAIFQWGGTGNPEITETEEIIHVLEGNFAIYEERLAIW